MHRHCTRRREIFGAAAVAPECSGDADHHSRAAAQVPSSSRRSPNAPPPRTSPRRTLFGFAAQLVLLCALMGALEGLLHPLTTTSDAADEWWHVARALPALGVLHVLLDTTALDTLWGLQLLVAAKIHKSALFPEDAERVSGVATPVFALMLLSYPLVRFCRRALARPWTIAVLLFTVAESSVLAFADDLVLPTKHALLFNCCFLACTMFVMAALMGSSTPSVKTTILAFGVVALLASSVRVRMGVSESTFAVSLAAQLLLTLATRMTLARHPCEEEEAATQVDEGEDEDARSYRSAFRFVDLLATFAIAAGLLAVLGLAAAVGLRHLSL